MENPRLQKIYQEAGRLFSQNGYSNTKMAEIARASGVAVGTMYSTFTGKDAVLSFVIQATLKKDYLSREFTLPIKPAGEAELLSELREVIDYSFSSILDITDENGSVCKDFLVLAEELFDLFADYLLALDMIEHNPEALSEMNKEYMPQKWAFFGELEKCLKMYIEAGQISPLKYIPLHVPFLIDTITWWAFNSTLSFPQVPVQRDTAKEICLGVVRKMYQL